MYSVQIASSLLILLTMINSSSSGWLSNALLKDYSANSNSTFTLKISDSDSPKVSFLGKACDEQKYKLYSTFEAFNTAINNYKKKGDTNQIEQRLHEIREKVAHAPTDELNQACILNSVTKPEMLDCVNKICKCIKSGVWNTFNLQEDNGQCVSPNEAWCLIGSKDISSKLSYCAGEGECQPVKPQRKFPCDEFGACKGGNGEVANKPIDKKKLKCPKIDSSAYLFTPAAGAILIALIVLNFFT